MREPVGLRPDAEEKHTLNLSFNINPWLAKSLVSALYGSRWAPRAAPFLHSCREPATPGRSAPPCFAAESARVGTLMSISEGAALCEPHVPSAHATPAEGLQVLGLVVAAFGERHLVDDL